ncbi:hypothetical protein O0L34_g7838 [Tuta absoluta]|nr:hypothetical protein O0L34_g7838 [Tuta absoluta]
MLRFKGILPIAVMSTLSAISVALESNIIPVFVLDEGLLDGVARIQTNPLHITSVEEFEAILGVAQRRSHCLIFFVEEDFAFEDISSKDEKGTPYSHMKQAFLEKKVKLLPRVINPYKYLRNRFQPFDFNTFHVRRTTTNLRLEEDDYKYIYIFLEDGANETRTEKLRRHDAIVQKAIFAVRQRIKGSVIGFYTGKRNPLEEVVGTESDTRKHFHNLKVESPSTADVSTIPAPPHVITFALCGTASFELIGDSFGHGLGQFGQPLETPTTVAKHFLGDESANTPGYGLGKSPGYAPEHGQGGGAENALGHGQKGTPENAPGHGLGVVPGNVPGHGLWDAPGNVPGQGLGEAPGNAPGYGLGKAPGFGKGNALGHAPGIASSSTPRRENTPLDTQGDGNAQGNAPGHGLGEAPGYGVGQAQGNAPGYGVGQAQGNAPGYGVGQAQGNAPGQGLEKVQGNVPGYGLGEAQGNAPGQGLGQGQGYGLGETQGNAPGQGLGKGQGYGLGEAPANAPGQGLGQGQGYGLGETQGNALGQGLGKGQGYGLGETPGNAPGQGLGKGQGNGNAPEQGLGQGQGNEQGYGLGVTQGNAPGYHGENAPGIVSSSTSRGEELGYDNDQRNEQNLPRDSLGKPHGGLGDLPGDLEESPSGSKKLPDCVEKLPANETDKSPPPEKYVNIVIVNCMMIVFILVFVLLYAIQMLMNVRTNSIYDRSDQPPLFSADIGD